MDEVEEHASLKFSQAMAERGHDKGRPMLSRWIVPSFLLALGAGCASLLAPNNAKHTKPEFETFRQKELDGYSKQKQAHKGDLASPVVAQMVVKGGTCARVLFETESGAKYTEGLKNVNFIVKRAGSQNEYAALPGLHGPGGVAALGCYAADTAVEVKLTDQSNNPTLGTGPYTLTVYSRPGTPEEIVAYENQDASWTAAKEQVAAEDAARAQKSAEGCQTCQTRYQGCIGAGRSRSTCDSEFKTCGFDKVGPSYLSTCKLPN
jgi:hypothetical protein